MLKNILNKWLVDERSASKRSIIDNICDYFTNCIVTIFPDTPITNSFKAMLMRKRGAVIGKRIKLLPGISIDRFSKLSIGDDTSIASNVLILAGGGVSIGARAMIGHGSKIVSAGHNIPTNRGPMRFSGANLEKVIVQNDVWLGVQVVVLPGVTIGEGAIIGAGSVVTKNIPPFSIYAGVPARLVRMRA